MDHPFQLAINKVCPRHDEDLTYYCPAHDEVICKICASTNHSRCPAQIPALEAATNSKAVLSTDLDNNFRILHENIQNSLTQQRTSLEELTKKEEQVRVHIKDIRLRLNRKLDALESDLLQSWIDQKHTVLPKMKSDIAKLEQFEEEIADLEKKTSIIKDYGTDIDYFLAGRQVQDKLYDHDENVVSVMRQLRKVRATFAASTDFDAFISKVKKLGDLFVEAVPSNLVSDKLKGQKRKVTSEPMKKPLSNDIKQVFIDKHNTKSQQDGIGDIFRMNLLLQNRFEIKKGFMKKNLCICSGIILDEKILLADRENKRFIVTSVEGEHKRNLDVTGRPWGVASINDNALVAVTFPYMGSGYIEILDTSINKVVKPINIGGLCRGIAFYRNLLYVVVFDKGILKVDIEGTVHNEIAVDVNGVFHLVVDHDKIFFTDEQTNSLNCYDLYGHEIWRFSHDRLKEPHGLAVDENGNVFVASYLFDHVMVVSADGTLHREILTNADGLLGPSSLFYDKRSKCLLVSSREHGRVSVYNVI